jgi:hypothetical protein
MEKFPGAMKKAVIIHGWGGSPKGAWIPWLKKELEARSIIVETPQMPNTDCPTIDHWVPELAKLVDAEDETYLIGYSIGCQTILRYLEQLKEPVKIKGVVFVAGWLKLSEDVTRNPEEMEIARSWVETPIDLSKIIPRAEKFVSIFSDDDPFVPEENWEAFKKLGRVIIEHGKGHIEDPFDITVLNSVLGIIK